MTANTALPFPAIEPRITVDWVSPSLEEALAWVGADPDRLPLFDAFVDLVRACQAVQIAAAALRRTEDEIREINAELAQCRAEMAALQGGRP